MSDDLTQELREALAATADVDPRELDATGLKLWYLYNSRIEQIIEKLVEVHDEAGSAARGLLVRIARHIRTLLIEDPLSALISVREIHSDYIAAGLEHYDWSLMAGLEQYLADCIEQQVQGGQCADVAAEVLQRLKF